jgi:ABC-type antimicrobial peptide transport system permease subunit
VRRTHDEHPEFGLALRTTGDPSALSTAATRVVRDLDPLQPVFDVKTLRDRLDGSQELTYARFRTAIMGAFGVTALLLASLGIYGVVRYSVAQRTQEFGIRIALGASPAQVFGMVLRQSLRATVIGGAIGILGSIAVGRFLASVLYRGCRGSALRHDRRGRPARGSVRSGREWSGTTSLAHRSPDCPSERVDETGLRTPTKSDRDLTLVLRPGCKVSSRACVQQKLGRVCLADRWVLGTTFELGSCRTPLDVGGLLIVGQLLGHLRFSSHFNHFVDRPIWLVLVLDLPFWDLTGTISGTVPIGIRDPAV